jgi:hypothetical protein
MKDVPRFLYFLWNVQINTADHHGGCYGDYNSDTTENGTSVCIYSLTLTEYNQIIKIANKFSCFGDDLMNVLAPAYILEKLRLTSHDNFTCGRAPSGMRHAREIIYSHILEFAPVYNLTLSWSPQRNTRKLFGGYQEYLKNMRDVITAATLCLKKLNLSRDIIGVICELLYLK